MHSNRGIAAIAALLSSAVIIAGISAFASDTTADGDRSVHSVKVNTAANSIDSLQALTDSAVRNSSIAEISSAAVNAADESIKSAKAQKDEAKKQKEAEEKKKEEEEKKKKEQQEKEEEIEESIDTYESPEVVAAVSSQGGGLTAAGGIYYGPSGKETYYNLDMSGVIAIMRDLGYSADSYPYWVRDDGCKMLGNYIMVACNLDLRPRGTIISTSLGAAIVCDTSPVFVGDNATQVDVAVCW